VNLSEAIIINKHTDEITYKGLTLTRDEVKKMNAAYASFDELISKIVNENSENYGLMENYTG
jgi:hypothetical protein